MSKVDQIVLAELGEKVLAIFENYVTWANADGFKDEIYEEVANLVSTYTEMN